MFQITGCISYKPVSVRLVWLWGWMGKDNTQMFDRLKSLFRLKPPISDPFKQFVVAGVEECKRHGLQSSEYNRPPSRLPRSWAWPCLLHTPPCEGDQALVLRRKFLKERLTRQFP